MESTVGQASPSMATLNSESTLVLTDIRKSFPMPSGSKVVLEGIDLAVKAGEFVAVIGPSGCGKSTLLRIIAGLDTDYEGAVHLKGKQVRGPGLERGFIFQEHRLFPWLTVEHNIAADLSLRTPDVRVRVDELIRLIRLDGYAKAFPKELSGGMAQRVALARALLREPDVLLLDEPFGALDSFTRAHMQDSLLDLWLQRRTPMMLVTHDIDEAIVLATRVIVLKANPGHIIDSVEIVLDFPRERGSEAFEAYRRRILDALSASHATSKTQ